MQGQITPRQRWSERKKPSAAYKAGRNSPDLIACLYRLKEKTKLDRKTLQRQRKRSERERAAEIAKKRKVKLLRFNRHWNNEPSSDSDEKDDDGCGDEEEDFPNCFWCGDGLSIFDLTRCKCAYDSDSDDDFEAEDLLYFQLFPGI